MTFKILGIAWVALALLAPPARAGSAVVSPAESEMPYQVWIDAAAVPTPDVTIEVLEVADDPCGGGAAACEVGGQYFDDGIPRIWLDRRWFSREPTRPRFLHEVGHVFDDEVLREIDRHRYTQMIGLRGHWYYQDEDSPGERFAESYRRCALGLKEAPSICRLIRGAYWRAGAGPA